MSISFNIYTFIYLAIYRSTQSLSTYANSHTSRRGYGDISTLELDDPTLLTTNIHCVSQANSFE